jgi:hypothetical protein
MRSPATLRWVGLALLGLLIAAGVSIAASRLASQQIGLASEPISAGDALAPVAQQPAKKHRHPGGKATTPTVTTPPATTTAPTTTETVAPEPQPERPSHSGGGDGEHGGGGGHADD